MDFETYVFRILNWHSNCMMSIEHDKYANRPYWPFMEITLNAELISPKVKGLTQTRISIIASDEADRNVLQKEQSAPEGIGYYETTKDVSSALISVKTDMVLWLTSILPTGRLTHMYLHGTKLRYRKSQIKSANFDTDESNILSEVSSEPEKVS